MVDYWWAWHEKTRGDTPTAFTGSDAKAIRLIRERLTVAVKRKIPEATEKDILETFKFILLRIEQLKDHYDFKFYAFAGLPIINSKLDTILALIRKHGATTNESITDKAKREAREQILRSSF